MPNFQGLKNFQKGLNANNNTHGTTQPGYCGHRDHES